MLVKESFAVGIRELLANKVRSFLSVFGIIIGIISLMVMMGIMNGIERTWVRYTEEMGGLEKAIITPKVPVIDGHNREDLMHPLSLEDAELLRRNPLIRSVSPEVSMYQYIAYEGKRKHFPQILGGTRGTLEVMRQTLAKGRTLTDEDVAVGRNVCVLGTTVRDKVFGPNIDPVGESVEIKGQVFEVVGLLKKNVLMQKGKNLLELKNDIVYIPVTSITMKLDPTKPVLQIQYTVRERKDISAAAKQAAALLAKAHRVEGDVNVQTLEESYLKSRKSFETLKASFSFIAGISLVVGGIGIMNIMIASIAQRVREIGIRKAVGATAEDILFQFLVETIIVSVLGGLMGIFASFFAVFAIRIFISDLEPVITLDAVTIAAVFSLIVGICSGVYPALKAAQLHPIDALRYQ